MTVYEPWHVLAFNRCPILLYLGIDISPVYSRLLRTILLNIADSFRKTPDSPLPINHFITEWDNVWVNAAPVMERPISMKVRERLAANGLRRLGDFYGFLAAQYNEAHMMPVEVRGHRLHRFERMDIDGDSRPIDIRIPIDYVTNNNTLFSLSVAGGASNPFMTPYSAVTAWGSIAWDGPHFVRNMASPSKVSTMRLRRSQTFPAKLSDYLAGMRHVVEQEVISGRYSAPSCGYCKRCRGDFYIVNKERFGQ